MNAVEFASLNVARLIHGLERLGDPEIEDRAALAALRRGLGKPLATSAEMFPVVVPLLGDRPLWPRDEQCAYGIASLYALHPEIWAGEGEGRYSRNLGASLNRLAQSTDSDGPERRFVALLNADREDLFEHLRSLVALLKSKEIPIDWTVLTRDVLRWDRPDRAVQRRWATVFWGDRGQPANEEGASDT